MFTQGHMMIYWGESPFCETSQLAGKFFQNSRDINSEAKIKNIYIYIYMYVPNGLNITQMQIEDKKSKTLKDKALSCM